MFKNLLFMSVFMSCFTLIYAQSDIQIIHEAHVTKWENSKAFMLECMELMPADQYNFKPSEDEMEFSKLCIHIIQNMVWLSGDYLDGGTFQNPEKDAEIGKEELMTLMTRALNFAGTALAQYPPHKWKTKVDFFAGEMPSIKIIHLMHDHMTHHRGQISVYLRLNGIKPPRYVGW